MAKENVDILPVVTEKEIVGVLTPSHHFGLQSWY